MKRVTVLSRLFLLALIIPLSVNEAKATPLSVIVTSYTNAACNGGTGSATATASGGTSPYTYLWSSNPTQATAMATGLSAGTYTVGVVDASFGTATATVTITQPVLLIGTAQVLSYVKCNGNNGGALTAMVTGGTSPYSYLWVPSGQTSASVSGMSAGCYTLAVTDHNGCTSTSTTCITQPTSLKVTTSATMDSSGCDGTTTALVTGGVSPYTYLWSDGGTNIVGTNYIASPLCPGSYCCIVTDDHGCMDSSCTYVDSNCKNRLNEPICIITLDTITNKCEVIWGRTNSPPSGGFGHYNIYRDTNNTYTLIHSQALNVLSEYIDPTSNPSAGPVSYKLSTVDSCGESALSSPHTSIYLTTTAALNVYILNWTAYVGFTPTKYIIYRGPSLSNLTAIDSVASNVFTYHDTLPPLGSYYVLEAVSPTGPCIPTAHKANSVSLLSGSFSNGFNTATLGVNSLENDISNLKIYPNPSNGMITLSYSMSGGDNVTVSILNELGQQVYTEQKHAANGLITEQLNLENLTSGIYILRIETSKGISVSKLSLMQK